MAKQQHMKALADATRQLATTVTLSATALHTGDVDRAKVERAAEGIAGYGKTLDRALRAAEAYIRTWDNESRWKRAKNVAIPKLTAGRKQLREMIKSTATTLEETGKLLKHYRNFAAQL